MNENGNEDARASSSSHSMDQGNEDEEEEQSSSATATMPPQQFHHVSLLNARDHSYLPDIASTFSMMDTDNERNFSSFNTPFPLVCWYTHDLVILPGVTLPLRLVDDPATQPESHQRAFQKLRQQIQSSRQCPGTVPAVYLGIWSDIDVSPSGDDSEVDDSSSTGNAGDDDLRHRQQQRQWRRQSWTRLGMGPNRLRRLSERVQQELSATDWHAIAAVAGDSSSASEDSDDDGVGGDNNDNDTRSHSSNGLPEYPMQNDSTGGSVQDTKSPTKGNNRKHWSTRPGPWHGRIGTLLSVVFTHQTTDETSRGLGPSSALNDNVEHDDNSLILTAKAIGRFRVVDDRASTLASDPYAHARRRITSGHLAELWVEEWSEKPLRLPPMRSAPSNFAVPRRLDPTTQVKELVNSIHAIPSLLGMFKIENQSSLAMEPIPFSYWLATNLPSISLRQKLKILEMPTATERLAYLQTCVEVLRDAEPVIQCANCQYPLARGRQVFSVAGAAGTTGAYVNPHGIIHETVTLRDLDLLEEDSDIWLLGGPETKDSWFPGYAWTICNCALCGNHLGWKFDKVFTSGYRAGVDNEDERPRRFFGLSAGQIQSKIPVRRPPSPTRRQMPGR